MIYIVIGIVALVGAICVVKRLPVPEVREIPVCPPADNSDICLKEAVPFISAVPYADEA